MLQLIKADLSGILGLVADYRPQLDPESLAMDIRRLERRENQDYLFPLADVYLEESYAYLCWTAYRLFPGPHVDALYLHVTHAVHGRPYGLVTVLDYDQAARDAEKFAAYSRNEAAAHVRHIAKHYRTHVRIGSTLDFIKYLEKAGESYGCKC